MLRDFDFIACFPSFCRLLHFTDKLIWFGKSSHFQTNWQKFRQPGSASADRRVTDNNVITVCCYNRYNHIIFRVQTHNVCRNQQTTVAVIIGCTRRHVSTWRYSTLSHEAAGAGQCSKCGCCQNHAMQISSPGAALLLAFIMEMFRHPDHRPQTSAILRRKLKVYIYDISIW